ncbi:MAG: hypothetical protein AAGB51_12125 [Planctomycetota bacterium]
MLSTLVLGATACEKAETKPGVQEAATAPEPAGPLGPLVEVVPGVYSGGSPYADPRAIGELRRLGIKTVISVDATQPDVAVVQSIGARSVHVPTRYSGFDPIQKLTLAKAVRDLERPIYIHCHRGLHRGPAAAACALIATGEMDPSRGEPFLTDAGTSLDYPGLWESVRNAKRLSDATLDGFSVAFDAANQPRGMVEAMSIIEASWHAMGAIREAGWQAPEHQPDLVPAAEAGLIHNTLRGVTGLDSPYSGDEEFATLLATSIAQSSDLENAIIAGELERMESAYRSLETTCYECHVAYRD